MHPFAGSHRTYVMAVLVSGLCVQEIGQLVGIVIGGIRFLFGGVCTAVQQIALAVVRSYMNVPACCLKICISTL